MDKILLIVEDNQDLLDMYEMLFTSGDYRVDKAVSGERALEILNNKEQKPNAILLDIMMPEISGFEVLKKIKEDEDLKEIPVIILTNLAQQHDIDKGLELGADLYLVKSQHEPEEIVTKVDSVIKRNREKQQEK